MTVYTAERLRWLRDVLDAEITIIVDDEVVGCVVVVHLRDPDLPTERTWYTQLIPARP